MKKKQEETFSHQLSYIIARLIYSMFNLLKDGILIAKKYKPLIIIYLVLIGLIALFLLLGYDCTYPVTAFVGVALIAGIYHYISEYEVRKLRKQFNAIFTEIKLIAPNEQPPFFLNEKAVSEYSHVYRFYTIIPLSTWETKKETLEMYLNKKIVDIRHDKKNNQVTQLITQVKDLPSLIVWDDKYIDYTNNCLRIGLSYSGIVSLDLEKHPHTFIAGETGSGKSVLMKGLIYQAIIKKYDVVLIDFKRGVSFSSFRKFMTIYYEYKETMEILKKMVEETKRRLDLFRENGVDNIKNYNKVTGKDLERKIIFIDELAELLKIRDKEISNILYECIETLTRISRSVGIHLIMGIQRPDSTIVNGQIKNNVSFRICGRFVDKEPSQIMLGNDKASRLANIKGRFIVRSDYLEEIQAFYYDDTMTPHFEQKNESEPFQEASTEIPKATPEKKASQTEKSKETKSKKTQPEKKEEEVQEEKKGVTNQVDVDNFDFDFSDILKK